MAPSPPRTGQGWAWTCARTSSRNIRIARCTSTSGMRIGTNGRRAASDCSHMNTARLQQLRSLMPREGLDALVCRLPENVVLLTGYWPVVGRSAAVLTLEHGPILLAPEMEAYAIQGAWAEDVHTFPVWRLVDPDPQDSLNELLAAVAARYGLKGRRVGYDGAFEDIAPTQRVAEHTSELQSRQYLVCRLLLEKKKNATHMHDDTIGRKNTCHSI